jgi:hypothetical protein
VWMYVIWHIYAHEDKNQLQSKTSRRISWQTKNATTVLQGLTGRGAKAMHQTELRGMSRGTTARITYFLILREWEASLYACTPRIGANS